jgi:predicted nuclease of predicted toxin-antitoxin system
MKFLFDPDVYAITAHYVRALGHDVVLAADIGFSRADDEELLKEAQAQERIFVTRDRDFGHLVFVRGAGSGVIYLRMLPSTFDEVHTELKKVFSEYSIEDLSRAFVVVKAKGHRFRRITED